MNDFNRRDGNESFAKHTARSGVWFVGFRLAIQALSWCITVLIARVLLPDDYGLMGMASILTGYVSLFSEIGLGSAIVQRKNITDEETSTVFWLCIVIGCMFAVVAFLLSYPTAWIFNETRVIPITQLISCLFVIGSLAIVPGSILTKNGRFKQIGFIEFCATAVSSISMYLMATSGFGVWTLIYGTIIQKAVSVVLIFYISGWKPRLICNLHLAVPLLKFGVNVSAARSLSYISQKADVFIVGKLFTAQSLGYYSFAMQLASIPTDKFVSIIQQVGYPVFAHYQDDTDKVSDFFLRATKYISILVLPLFTCGIILSKELILLVLGIKWLPIVDMFRAFCFANLVICIASLNSMVHLAQNRPRWVLLFTGFNTILMTVGIFLAARRGFDAVVIPWVTISPLLAVIWTMLTVRRLGISIRIYFRGFIKPIAGTLLCVAGIYCVRLLSSYNIISENVGILMLSRDLFVGISIYILFIMIFENNVYVEMRQLLKR